MGNPRVFFVRVLILVALCIFGAATTARAEFCADVCYPTCDDYEGHCADMGGWTDSLCSCSTNSSGGNGCSFPECHWQY